jgi:hypothetical protein
MTNGAARNNPSYGCPPFLTEDFLYPEEPSRALAVHSSAIIEALQMVYDARPLADELLGKRR